MAYYAEYVEKFNGRVFFKAHGNFYELIDPEFIGNGGANGVGGVKRTGKPVLIVVQEKNRHHVTLKSTYFEGIEVVKIEDVAAFNRAVAETKYNAPPEVIDDLLDGIRWVLNPDKYFKEKEGIIGVGTTMYFYKRNVEGYTWSYAEAPHSFWAEFGRSWNWCSFTNEEGFNRKLSQMHLSAKIQQH